MRDDKDTAIKKYLQSRAEQLKELSPFKATRYKDACLSKIDFDQEDSELLSRWIAAPKDILYLYSPPGVGKTYFCSAIYNHFASKGFYVCFYREGDFFSELHRCINEKTSADYRLSAIAEYEFLMFDDLGSTRSSPDGLNLTGWVS